uniref:Chitinase A n=1 Tax=Cycas revoluta TaxID=3396 RepID=UPI0004F13E72|nr:Chain A, Chitinase A [Cycas revoluta]4MNM_A Chain A, Chitinase A [Cycas revoluta]
MQNALKVGFWPAYSVSEFPPSKINSRLFTHLYYAFAELNAPTFEVRVPPGSEKTAEDFTPTVRRLNPSVKTLISIGGWGSEVRDNFAKLNSDASARQRFVKSSIALARRYGFHGLDLDYQYPEPQLEMENFVKLVSELTAAIREEARTSGKPRLLLTEAVYFHQKLFPWEVVTEYPVQFIAAGLDWVNVMAYDFHGSWENFTGAPAALRDPNSKFTASVGIESFLAAGMPPEKLVLGIPLFGRSWLLKNNNEVGIGAPAVGAGPVDGALSFSEIQNFIRGGAREVFDTTTVSAYAYKDNVWVGYDNQQSVALKVQYAKEKRLGGYFFWSVNQDIDAILPKIASDTWGG